MISVAAKYLNPFKNSNTNTKTKMIASIVEVEVESKPGPVGLKILTTKTNSNNNNNHSILFQRRNQLLIHPSSNSFNHHPAAAAAAAYCFLKTCFLCHKHLSPNKDIYMYRGDQGFCSEECRSRQIYIDDVKQMEISTQKMIQQFRNGGPRCHLISHPKSSTASPIFS